MLTLPRDNNGLQLTAITTILFVNSRSGTVTVEAFLQMAPIFRGVKDASVGIRDDVIFLPDNSHLSYTRQDDLGYAARSISQEVVILHPASLPYTLTSGSILSPQCYVSFSQKLTQNPSHRRSLPTRVLLILFLPEKTNL